MTKFGELMRWPARAPLAAIIAALVGIFAGLWGAEFASAIEDRLRPVSVARAADVQRVGEEIRFRLLVTRQRQGCRLVSAYAYAVTPEGFALRANADRIDHTLPRDIPAGVEVDTGLWRVWPVAGARVMVVYTHHLCGDRLVSTKLVELPT
jgi:hypothetical protein